MTTNHIHHGDLTELERTGSVHDIYIKGEW